VYIKPNANGALTRGKIEVLPTGRSFFAINPTLTSTKAAWEIGVKMTEHLLESRAF
jgi:cobaltochelatase CobN